MTRPEVGDVVRAKVSRVEIFGAFCEFEDQEILVLIPEVSWIASFASCQEVISIGDELEVEILHVNENPRAISASVRANHPKSNPWDKRWSIRVGDEISANVLRWVEKPHRCHDSGGYLLALRPSALVMLCGVEAGRLKACDECQVVVTAVDALKHQVRVSLVE
jgi:ribosomal protein S1